MNTISLRTQVRFKTGIDSTVKVTNAEILTLLNIGYNLMCERIASINEDFFEEQKVKFNLALNSALYSLPTDFLKFKQLRLAYTTPSNEEDYKVATPYDPAAVSDVQAEEESISTSNPIVDITNNYMRIKPTPTSAVTNGGEIYYIARPSALVNTGDTPLIPQEHHDLLAIFAAKEICMKFMYWDRYKVLTSEYENKIEKMVKELAERNINNPLRFRNVLETQKKVTVTELWP